MSRFRAATLGLPMFRVALLIAATAATPLPAQDTEQAESTNLASCRDLDVPAASRLNG